MLCVDIAEKSDSMIRRYSDLVRIPTFEERIQYLRLYGVVGAETFGMERMFNQRFYKSQEWRNLRNHIILRDKGCDMALKGYEIEVDPIYIHHMNPITLDDIETLNENLLDPEFLVCVSLSTHNFIHYGSRDIIALSSERKPNDTCPWRK